MKKRYFAFIPAISCMGLSSISAETKLESSLEKVASKVDTDGTYLQLNKFDGDIETLVEYGELALDLAKKEETSIPADLKVEKIVKLIGLDQMKALAASSKKVDGSWNNLSYIYTGGSNKGLLSVYGDTDEKVSVADFAPETTDIALRRWKRI